MGKAKRKRKKASDKKEKDLCPWCSFTEKFSLSDKEHNAFWDNIDQAQIALFEAFESLLKDKVDQIKDEKNKRKKAKTTDDQKKNEKEQHNCFWCDISSKKHSRSSKKSDDFWSNLDEVQNSIFEAFEPHLEGMIKKSKKKKHSSSEGGTNIPIDEEDE